MAEPTTDLAHTVLVQNGLKASLVTGNLLARLRHAISNFLIIEQDDETLQAGAASRAEDDEQPRPGARIWY